MGWMAAVGRDRIRIIGGLEMLGAIGLILPAATRILTWLTPVAASCLAVLMLLFVSRHFLGEMQQMADIVANTALVLVALWLIGSPAVAALFTERAEING